MDEEKQHVCGYCYRQFTYNYTLRKHLRIKHPAQAPPTKEKKGSLCPLCSDKFHSSDFYVEHLTQKHNVAIEREKLEFNSQQEFYEWKRGVESKVDRYVQLRGGRTQLNGFIVIIYECHRSGMFVPRGEGKRKLKNKGSKKINGLCPAKIRASISEQGIVNVDFIKTHVGHDSGEEHIPLSHLEKDVIAEMIKTKLPFDIIVEKLRKIPTASKRLQTVTKKDLHNIVCSYKLKEFVQTHTNQSKSTKKVISESTDIIQNVQRIKSDTADATLNSNKLREISLHTLPVGIITQDNEVAQDVMLFPGDQNTIAENILILGLSESSYVEEVSLEIEKDRLKNEFLVMLDSLNSRQQLQAVKNALSPFMPSQPLFTHNSNDITTYNLASLLNDKSATIKICP